MWQHNQKNELLSHGAEWRLTGSVKLYIVGTQLDGGVTGRDHKSDQAREAQHMPGIMSNQPRFRQGTHPLLQLSHMQYLQSTINDLISVGPRSLSVTLNKGIFTLTQTVCSYCTCVCVCINTLCYLWWNKALFKHRCWCYGLMFVLVYVFFSALLATDVLVDINTNNARLITKYLFDLFDEREFWALLLFLLWYILFAVECLVRCIMRQLQLDCFNWSKTMKC